MPDAITARTGAPDDGRAAVALLYGEHATRLLRLATVLLGDRAAAEDVVQDAFTALYAGWHRLRDREAAIGYLHRSVVNASRSRQRRAGVAKRHIPAPMPDAASAEEAALAAMPGGPVVAAIRDLPRREREVLLLRHYLDLSERQTADALGLRPGSVKAYGSRGLERLRMVLGAGGTGERSSA